MLSETRTYHPRRPMHNEPDQDVPLNPATDGGVLPSSWPPPSDASGAAPTWALVDGLGVYTASTGSPFLTTPALPDAASANPESTVANLTDGTNRELRELLRRHIQGVHVRFRLSEEEISGLLTDVLDLIDRHLRNAVGRTNHGHGPASTL